MIKVNREPSRLPAFNPTPLDRSGLDLVDAHVDHANGEGFNTEAKDPREKLSTTLDLFGDAMSTPATARALGVDEGQLCEFILNTDHSLPDDAMAMVDVIYAIARNFWLKYGHTGTTSREKIGNVRRQLREETFRFKANEDDSSPNRSALQAIIAGDARLVAMRMERQLRHFDDTTA